MALPYLLLDIDGVLIPFPAADGSTPLTHVRDTRAAVDKAYADQSAETQPQVDEAA